MYDRNGKSERILTKLRVLDYEYICDRIAKFHKKILFTTRVINIQILTTKYFSFQYSVTYWGQALRQDNAPAHRAREHRRRNRVGRVGQVLHGFWGV